MKKILAVCLSLVMLFGVFSVAASAEAQEDYTDYPVILVPGYISSYLYKIDEQTGEKVIVWGDIFSQIGSQAGGSLGDIAADAAKYLLAGDVDPIAKRLGDGFNRIFADVAYNGDGEGVVPLYSLESSAEATNYANLMEKYPDGELQFEKEIMAVFAEKISYEHLYVFCDDFRKGGIDAAESLKAYIDDVISYENSVRAEKGEKEIDKVNLFAVSYGGLVSGTYLSLYGSEGKVNNAVLTIPALAGAGIAYDVFNLDVEFDEDCLLTFIQHAFPLEEDYNIFLQANQLGLLDELIEALMGYVSETIGKWGSLWDFIPLDYYEEIKSMWLDETEDAGLIAKSDRMHYEIMSPEGENYYGKGFKKAQSAGTNVYILAGYDNAIVTGSDVSSDAIIPTQGATGATVAPLGQRFADGYTQKVDTGFYQVSPSMTVDASTAYLPEHTWFIENYYHGMTAKDNFTFSLMQKLLLTDESFSVHSFSEYPQFHATTNSSHGVFAAFDSSKEGFVSSEDKALVVTNISAGNTILVSAINVAGLDIEFNFIPFVLKAGESKAISFKGEIPEVSLVNFDVTVTYALPTVTPIGERSFDFTVMNGDAAEYDSENPFTQADYPPVFDGVLDEDVNEILSAVGVKGIVATVYNIVYKFIYYITSLIELFK